MANKATPRSVNAGRPDYVELENQQRIQHSQTRGYNSLPNPVEIDANGASVNRGNVRNPDAPAWRVGLNAEKYHAMTLRYEEMKARGKKTDDFRPELSEDEQADYAAFLKKDKKTEKSEK